MAGMDKKAPAVTTGQGVDVITAIDTKANKLTIVDRRAKRTPLAG